MPGPLRQVLLRRFLTYPLALWLALLAGLVFSLTPLAPAAVFLAALGFPIYWYVRLFHERLEFLTPFIYRVILNFLVLTVYVQNDITRSQFYFIDLVATFLTIGISVIGLSIQRFVGYTWRETLPPHALYMVLVAPALPFIIVSAFLRLFGYNY